MKSKKIISLLLAATCVFGLTACGSTESSTAASTGSAAAETSAAEAKTETKASGLQIAIPNDTTNEARALQLLAAQGLIALKEGVGLEATPNDVVDNPKGLKFEEVVAAQIPNLLADVDLGIANGNYALGAGIAGAAIAKEGADSEAAQTYPNVLAIREGDDRPELKALIEAMTSPEVKAYIEKTYEGTVIAVF